MRAAIVLCLCAGTGCAGAEVSYLTWDTIDLDDVQAKLDAPTATVADLKAGIEEIGDELGDLEILGGEGFNLFEAIDDPNETTPTVYESTDDQTTGTQIYLRLACPGPESTKPDADFAFGSIELVGPTLQIADESVAIAGPIYMTFDECRAGGALMTGGIPGYYDDVANRLGWDGELTIELVEADRILRQGPVILYQDAKEAAVAWFIVPDRYGVVRLVNGSDFISFGVELADGSATCTWGDGLSCETTSD
jgi:hypothetical protein